MDGSQIKSEGRMEGWLYLIRSNRIGLQYSRKRYFVLEDHLLKSFKSLPDSKKEVASCLLLSHFKFYFYRNFTYAFRDFRFFPVLKQFGCNFKFFFQYLMTNLGLNTAVYVSNFFFFVQVYYYDIRC